MPQIVFEEETQYGVYRDALFFPDDQPLPSDAVIQGMKQERVTNWIYNVENPPAYPPPEQASQTELDSGASNG